MWENIIVRNCQQTWLHRGLERLSSQGFSELGKQLSTQRRPGVQTVSDRWRCFQGLSHLSPFHQHFSWSGIVRGTLARPKIMAKSTIFNRNFILKKSASTFWICWWLLIYFIRRAKPQTLNFILEHLRAMNFIWRTRAWFHMISWHSVAPGAALWGGPLPGPKSWPNQQFLVGTLY